MTATDIFRPRLDSMIDLKHPLAVLACRLPWDQNESALAPFCERRNRASCIIEGDDWFVMDPFDPEDYADLKAINEEPIRMIDDMDLNDLRRYIHTLQRADKWSDGLWSPVLEALASGALQRAGQRLLDAPVSS